jgi:hypothetical protein
MIPSRHHSQLSQDRQIQISHCKFLYEFLVMLNHLHSIIKSFVELFNDTSSLLLVSLVEPLLTAISSKSS